MNGLNSANVCKMFEIKKEETNSIVSCDNRDSLGELELHKIKN